MTESDSFWVRKIAQVKARMTRGGSWIAFLTNIGIFAIIANNLFAPFGLSLNISLVISAILYFGFNYYFGLLDEKYGIWEQENAYNQSMNPATMKILDHVSNGADGKKFTEDVRKKV